MVAYILDNGMMIIDTAMVHYSIKMGPYMKVIGKIMNAQELVEYGKLMAILIRGNGRIIQQMGKVFLNLRMAI